MTEPSKPKSGWRIVRRILIALAILATLVAIFYTEEDWRGKRAWENYKAQLEAQGVVLDWDKFIPPPVPDDQNFFTYSTNFLKFKQVQTDAETEAVKKISWLHLDPMSSNRATTLFPAFDTSKSGPIVVAKIIVSPDVEANLPSGTNTFTVTLDDAGTANQIRTRIRDFIRTGIGRFTLGVQGFAFSELQLTNLPLVQIFVQTPKPPSVKDLNAFCPSDAVAKIGRLQVVATSDKNTFDILLTDMRITAAADYLAWSDQFVPAFDEIREALKRPYAVLPGDYSKPYQAPIPNFVLMRGLAQTLGQRAQCYLLLGEPDKALHELTLIHDVCRVLVKPPGQAETLVEAMINVAIMGLYQQVISEGLQRNAWQEPQLVALQEQLGKINLPAPVVNAFESEQAATTRVLENVTPTKLKEIFSLPPGDLKWALWPLIKSALLPRGWTYQNMVTAGKLTQTQIQGVDVANKEIQPEKFKDVNVEMHETAWPYKFMAVVVVPNFTKAWQVTAYNQTMVNETQIACALERYHLAHGQYPDTLETLVPQFIQTIPNDIIGGQPLYYRRTSDGKFLLYSVGWNETDDGGQETPGDHNVKDWYAKGDWVWPN